MDPTSPSNPTEHEKIPPHATRVHHGIIFDVFQWQQLMFDGTTATFEALRRFDSTEVILVDGDEILIAEQEQPGRAPFLSPFGGRVNEDEAPLAGAKRELREESGYVADHWQLIERSGFPWSKLDWINYLYFATGARRVQEPSLDAGEKITVRRCGVEEFLELGRHEIQWKHPAGFYEWVVKPNAAATLRSTIATMKGAS